MSSGVLAGILEKADIIFENHLLKYCLSDSFEFVYNVNKIFSQQAQ